MPGLWVPHWESSEACGDGGVIARGRAIACHVASENRCPYRSMVIVAVEWPRITCTAFTSAPAAISNDAAVCRRSWIVVPSTPAAFVASIHRDRARKLVFVQTPPVGLGNRYPPGAVVATRSRT